MHMAVELHFFFLFWGCSITSGTQIYNDTKRYIRLSVCVIISANWTVSFECDCLSVSSVFFWVFRCRLCLPNLTDINFTLVAYAHFFSYSDANPTITINKFQLFIQPRFVTFSREIWQKFGIILDLYSMKWLG